MKPYTQLCVLIIYFPPCVESFLYSYVLDKHVYMHVATMSSKLHISALKVLRYDVTIHGLSIKFYDQDISMHIANSCLFQPCIANLTHTRTHTHTHTHTPHASYTD